MYYDGSNIRYIYLYMEYTLLYFYTAKQIYIYCGNMKYKKSNKIFLYFSLLRKRNGFSRTFENRIVNSFKRIKNT